MKITELTPEQQAALPAIRDEWLAHGLSTEPADRPRAEAGVASAYRAAGLTPPEIVIWLDYPLGGAMAAAMLSQVRDQVRAQVRAQVGAQVGAQVWDQVWAQVGAQVGRACYGSHDSGWLSFYAAMSSIGIDTSLLDGQREVASAAGWWWPFDGAVVLTDRPVSLARDNRGRLHHESGPALVYRDGFAVHAWHGVRVPEDFWSWDVERALTEPNAEIRRCAIERIGWDQIIDLLTLVDEADDPGNPGHKIRLYDLPANLVDLYSDDARILIVSNASLDKGGHRRVFGLPVPASHSSAVDAAADLFDVPAAAYRSIARAT